MGGCAVDLLLTDPAAAPARVTYDVDLVARVEVLVDYHALEEEFARLGFKRDMAQEAPISTGVTILLISAPAFMATKFEAFLDRGRGDVLGSHDLEDIVNVLDGRPELVSEIASAEPELRQYLATQCGALLAMPDFINALPGLVFPDESLAGRVKLLVQRLGQIAELTSPA